MNCIFKTRIAPYAPLKMDACVLENKELIVIELIRLKSQKHLTVRRIIANDVNV